MSGATLGRVGFAVAAALASTACFSTSYTPKVGPGIQLTHSNLGTPTFHKDGKEIGAGYFDKELPSHFAEVPEAQKDVATWRERKLYALGFSIIASAITIAGVAAIEPGAGFSARNAFSLVSILSGSFPLSFAAVMFNWSADARLQDALNRYNDWARAKAATPGVKVSLGGLQLQW